MQQPSTVPTEHDISYFTTAVSPTAPDTIRLHGELDFASVPALSAVLDDALSRDDAVVRIDVGGLTFCDSSGAHALAGFRRVLHTRGRRLQVEAADARLRRVFRLTRTAELLEAG
ncbi:MAG: STAS domain-containing protein [Jatrophihabitans sp.]|uniref:STAS domain-containing protein n=1 Tax=Jatrophihabitans sp. TaxID=1932789 RepID=UPI003F7E6911